MSSPLSPFWPRRLAALVAVLVMSAVLRFVIRNETPVGGITGQVRMVELGLPLEGAEITIQSTRTNRDPVIRRTVSGAKGRFTLHNVPTGEYQIAASSHAHQVQEVVVRVAEGKVTPLTLNLERSLPSFRLIVHQRVYGSKEKPHVAISGYVDPDRFGKDKHDVCHLHIYQARLSNVLKDAAAADGLSQVGRSYDEAPRLPSALLHPESVPAPAWIVDRSVGITGEDREGFYYQNLRLDHLNHGLYLLDLQHGKDTGCTWLLVTDTALIVKQADAKRLSYVVDMESGKPIKEAIVQTFRSGRLIASGSTDERGLAEFSIPPHPEGESSDVQDVTVAMRGRDEAVVQQNNNSNETNGRYAVCTYTDRPIYRPGQHINFKAIVRSRIAPPDQSGLRPLDAAEAPPGPRYRIPAGARVEAEILDPSGDLVTRQSLTVNSHGSLHGGVDLLNEAATGVYTLKLRINGEEHTHDVTVASYRKPEFAVTVTPDKKRYTRGDLVTMTVSAQYYFGAPLAGAPVHYAIYGEPDWAAEYPDDYGDEDGGRPAFIHSRQDAYYGGSVGEGTTALDANGKAVIRFRAKGGDVQDQDGPQEMIYTCNATVTEGVDREVEQNGEARASAGDFRLTVAPDGYVAAPGLPNDVIVTARDYDGNPLPNVPITLETAYESWRNDDYKKQVVGRASAVTGPDGRATVPVTPSKAGSFLLTARAKDQEGHAIQGRSSLWAANDAGGDLDTTYDDLTLLTDRRHYRPGDTARVLINTSRLGETVLLTVEGDRVYRSQTVEATHHSTVVRLPLPTSYGPNVFLSACYVRNKHFARSDTPIRVALPASELHLTVHADRDAISGTTLARYQPGNQITYRIEAADAKGRPTPCEFSLGVVDESIYALQEDDPAALRDAFYPRRYNAVQTLFSFAAEYLGDADKSEPKITARKRFQDTAYWLPDGTTDANGRATVTFSLPDNLTTWRATVMAHTPGTEIGRTVQKVIVAKPFMVRIEAPRTLTQRDHSEITALVHNETGQPQTAQVKLQASRLTIGGTSIQTVSIPAGGVGRATWSVTAEQYGQADLKVTAWTPLQGGTQYTDGMEIPLPIRPHGSEQEVTFAGRLTPGKEETEVVRLDPAAIPGLSRMTVRITPSLAGAMVGSLDYLTGYPYGCVEQTLSRMLPDLLVQRTLHLHGLGDVPDAPKLPKMVRSSLLRLYRFQHQSGAWGWWEHDEDDAWMTAYVLYGLAEARESGYDVPDRVLMKGGKAAAAMMPHLAVGQRPFLLYALVRIGMRDEASEALSKLDLDKLSSEGLAYVVLTSRLLGAKADAAVARLNHKRVAEGDLISWPGHGDESDSRSATASVLRALLVYDPHSADVEPALRWLMVHRTGDYWEDTRDTSTVLAALCDYLGRQSVSQPGGEVKVEVNGRSAGDYQLTAQNLQQEELVLRVPTADLVSGKNEVKLTRLGGDTPIFYSVEMRQTVAGEETPAAPNEGLKVEREYLRIASDNTTRGLSYLPTDGRLTVGDTIRVRLTLTVPKEMSYVLIEDAFPAGCEVNERGDAEEITDWSFWWSSVDVRDDRIAFFARSLSKGKQVIEYNLRVQTPGSYHVLPTLVQAMYDRERHASSAEARVEAAEKR